MDSSINPASASRRCDELHAEKPMPSPTNRIESTLLRRINERRLLEVIQQHGPASRAGLTRVSGLTAPTVSKAVDSLLNRGLVEELDPVLPALGRPGRLVRLATESVAVLGVAIDPNTCCVAATGLDGLVTAERTRRFATPSSYGELLDAIIQACKALIADCPATPLGIGVSVPGLVNERVKEVIFSPNLHILDKRNPAHDLQQRLGIEAVMLQETDGLCLAERLYGDARGLSDFAMLDVSAGLGVGVMSGGEILAGHSGMAGEVGHITVTADGTRCGCGNHGCLETLATDAALVRLISEQEGRPLDMDAVEMLLAEQPGDMAGPVGTVTEYLAIAIAAVINIFNPTALFVHGRLLAGSPERFAKVIERVRQRALTASLADCTIRKSSASCTQGAVAGIIYHFTQSWAPSVR